MKKIIPLVLIVLLSLYFCIGGFCPLAGAQVFDEDYTDNRSSGSNSEVSAQLGLHSDRVYRGQNLYNGSSAQGQVRGQADVGPGAVYGRVFLDTGLDDRVATRGATPRDLTEGTGDAATTTKVQQVTPAFTEVDYDFGYTMDFKPVNVSLGHQWLTYSKSTPRLQDTAEIYGRVETEIPAHPYALVAYDYDEFEGFYYETGISETYSLEAINQAAKVIPSLTLGFNSDLDGSDSAIYEDAGITHVGLGVRTILPLNRTLSFQPEINYNEGIDDATTSDFFFGMNVVADLNGAAGSAK